MTKSSKSSKISRCVRPTKNRTARKTGKKARRDAPPRKAGAPPRGGTKQAILMEMLSQPKGATIADLVAATGWQAHSVRGAISGTLKKQRRLTVTSAVVEARGRVYRITGGR